MYIHVYLHMYYGTKMFPQNYLINVYLLVKNKYIIAWTLAWTPPLEGPLEAYVYVYVYVYTDVNTYVHTSVWE